MPTRIVKAICTTIICFNLAACVTSPTGRSQLNLISDGQLSQMGYQAFEQMKKKEKVSTSSKLNNYVNCVVKPLIRTYPATKVGNWEVVVFDDKSANAFALPGGKIGVYSGLLKVANTQDQLAAVIGHEISHVLANHSNERMSQNYVTQLGMSALGSTVNSDIMAVLGLGAQYGILLPYSRVQESEADILGQELMANAGFDPSASVLLWENMQKLDKKAPPELMSTHPASSTRIAQLRANLGRTQPLYQRAKSAGRKPQC